MPNPPLAAELRAYSDRMRAEYVRRDEISEFIDRAATTAAELERGAWVACAERLPEEREEVLIATGLDVTVGSHEGGVWFNLYDECPRPTHWAPLPEPPAPSATESQP
jgi:hypothetical protein